MKKSRIWVVAIVSALTLFTLDCRADEAASAEVTDIEIEEDGVYYVHLDDYFSQYWVNVSVFNNTNLSTEINTLNCTLKIMTPKDWNGAEEITLVASDNQHETEMTTINVVVHPVNDMPYFTTDTPSKISVKAGESFDLHLSPYVGDVDGDRLTVSVVHPYEGGVTAVLDPETLEVHISIAEDFSGSYFLTLGVSDGEWSSTTELELEVTPIPADASLSNISTSPLVYYGLGSLAALCVAGLVLYFAQRRLEPKDSLSPQKKRKVTVHRGQG